MLYWHFNHKITNLIDDAESHLFCKDFKQSAKGN